MISPLFFLVSCCYGRRFVFEKSKKKTHDDERETGPISDKTCMVVYTRVCVCLPKTNKNNHRNALFPLSIWSKNNHNRIAFRRRRTFSRGVRAMIKERIISQRKTRAKAWTKGVPSRPPGIESSLERAEPAKKRKRCAPAITAQGANPKSNSR